MAQQSISRWFKPLVAQCGLALLLGIALASAATAQRIKADEPTAFQPNTVPADQTEQSPAMKFFSAVCWYIPNRILDITDIPRLYLSVGDGNGISLRATKYLAASWINNDALAVGWTKRTGIIFGSSYDERYFGFLAAQQGKMVNDPSEIGVSAHLVVAGLNAAVSLGEVVDLVAGVVGIDLMGDDHGPVLGRDYTPEPKEDAGKQPPPENLLPPAPAQPIPKPAADDSATTGTQPMATEPAPAAQ